MFASYVYSGCERESLAELDLQAQFLVNMARESGKPDGLNKDYNSELFLIAMSAVRLRQSNERSYQLSAQSESFLAGACSVLVSLASLSPKLS